MKMAATPTEHNKPAAKPRAQTTVSLWRKQSPVAILLALGLIATAYLKASIFVPRVGDEVAGAMFDNLDREVLQDLQAISDSPDTSIVNIDFGRRTIDGKYVVSLARVAHMGAMIREKALTDKLQTTRLGLINDIGDMVKDLGDCGQDHSCKEIASAIQNNQEAVAQTKKNGEDLLAVQSRVRDLLTPRTDKPSIDEEVEYLKFLMSAARKPATLIKGWHDKPPFGDIAELQSSTAELLRIHRDLYREYLSRRRVQEAIASIFSRSS